MIGQTISHYRIVEQLGAGGMGVVYKAHDDRLDRAVALKLLPEKMAQQPQALERFRREARAASALNHPNICTIYDIGDQDGRAFIAMEFIDGETLRAHINSKPIPLEETLKLGIQIAEALDAAHAEGIIHRDIKPANIFVTKRGQAKVLDFGLAKLAPKGIGGGDGDSAGDSEMEPTSIVGIISGTPSYMSPEQVRGDDLDARTDVFSLGLLLYEMTTGRQAFGGGTGGMIIEAVLTRAPTPVRTINPDIPPRLEEIISRALHKDRDQRYQSAAAICEDLKQLKASLDTGQTVRMALAAAPRSGSRKWFAVAGAAAGVLALTIAGWLLNAKRVHALSGTDTIVLADFNNKTGDAVFDDTLQQGLAIQLEQSPFLSLVSEGRIRQTLQLMGRPPDTKLTPDIARELCERTGSKAFLSGSILNLGSEYVIGIKAVNCQTGDDLAQEQVTAENKEHVLNALGRASTQLREKLGESLKSVQKLDAPIDQATTPSLEALQAYSLGRKAILSKGDYSGAAQMFARAISLDPNFAMAYASMGTSYHNLGEENLSVQNTKKAYELRDHVSEWERFYIESHYDQFVTGDLEKASQAYELWGQTYPREPVARINLGVVYQSLGQHDKALAKFREAATVAPPDALDYGNLVVTYIHLNRLNEASTTAKEAIAKNGDSPDLHLYLYQLAFIQGDSAAMAQQTSWALGRAEAEGMLLYSSAESAAYSGEISKARELFRQAQAAAERAGAKEAAAEYASAEASQEALYGDVQQARQDAASALALSNGRDAQYTAALAFAAAGDSDRAGVLAGDLDKRYPKDTLVQFNYLPTIRAQLALNRSENLKALDLLQVASPYEEGVPNSTNFAANLYPMYVRGEAYLAARRGADAIAQFQRIIQSSGLVINEPIGALAHFELARAEALSGDTGKSKAAYEEFFQLWKNADPDVPVLKQARAEYAMLQ
jgi:eukaryotic-like serine/threonine-protein kinase